MKRIVCTALVLVLLGLSLVGCGKTSNSGNASSAKPVSGSGTSVEVDYGVPVPKFLEASQKQLYADAYNAYLQFSVANGFGTTIETNTPTHEQGSFTYYKANGTYTKWSDFNNAMLKMFTKTYFEETLNALPHYIAVGDDLYCLMGDRAPNPAYQADPDTFELISETEDEINFIVVGTYKDYITDDSGKTTKSQETYTQSFQLKLVKVDGEWRFEQFNITF